MKNTQKIKYNYELQQQNFLTSTAKFLDVKKFISRRPQRNFLTSRNFFPHLCN